MQLAINRERNIALGRSGLNVTFMFPVAEVKRQALLHLSGGNKTAHPSSQLLFLTTGLCLRPEQYKAPKTATMHSGRPQECSAKQSYTLLSLLKPMGAQGCNCAQQYTVSVGCLRLKTRHPIYLLRAGNYQLPAPRN